MRKNKIIMALIVLIIVVMGIGFASFSNSLTIISGSTVTPNDSEFKIEFTDYDSKTDTCTQTPANTITPTTGSGESAKVSGTSITGLKANFTKPEERVSYRVCVHNKGQYDAYLKSVMLGGATCTPGDGTPPTLVTEACKSIKITLQFSGNGASLSETYTSTNNNINSHKLNKEQQN